MNHLPTDAIATRMGVGDAALDRDDAVDRAQPSQGHCAARARVHEETSRRQCRPCFDGLVRCVDEHRGCVAIAPGAQLLLALDHRQALRQEGGAVTRIEEAPRRRVTVLVGMRIVGQQLRHEIRHVPAALGAADFGDLVFHQRTVRAVIAAGRDGKLYDFAATHRDAVERRLGAACDLGRLAVFHVAHRKHARSGRLCRLERLCLCRFRLC